jgi:hypothetical protein
MGANSFKKTQPDQAVKLLSLATTHTTAPYAGGVDQFTLNHNLGYIPPFRIFFQSDDHPERLFRVPTNYDNNVPSLTLNTYNKFTMVFTVTRTQISFGVTNRDTVSHVLKIFALVYAEKATATQ